MLCLVGSLAFAGVLPAAETQAVKPLLTRYTTNHASVFIVESIPAEEGRDVYEIESANGRIILRGNSGVAQASALYHYLKEFCHAHVSWNGDNLALPATLPLVPQKIRVVSPVIHRMAYNYCTFGYTMPFWEKAQWDRELDWLALHGVNMILVVPGQDAVWQNTFMRFGYTKEEMRQWLCSPVHQPWQFMQNMEGVLPPPQSVIDARAELGRYIVSRCRELGIKPILQGYYGMLPAGFARKHPGAAIVPQGGWAGNNRRPDMLNPGDPLYPKIAQTFMEEQKKLYGDVEFLAADPFHEGGTSQGMSRATVYKQIQDEMLKFDPKITLVKQCWQTSNKEMFDAGVKEKSLALDLNCDYRPFWKKANGYEGTPWVWCFLFNFGGNLALEGNPSKLVADFGGTLVDPKRNKLVGTALVPEGSHTNPMMYELMSEMGWRGAPADANAWVNNYLHARYGAKNAIAEEAWQGILATAYAMPPSEGPINSIITARPQMNTSLKARTWAPGTRVNYDNRKLVRAWAKLLEAAPVLGPKDTYRYDLADVARQTLTNHARILFEKSVAARQQLDLKELQKNRDALLGLIADLDELTGTREDWLMGAWVADARRWGKTPEEKAYMDKIARMILTTWVENPNTDLSDYANREWNGLLGEYYLPRWKMFFESAEENITKSKEPNMAAFHKKRSEFETAWISSGKATMREKPTGDTVAVARKFLVKYGAAILSNDPLPRIDSLQPVWTPQILAKGSSAAARLAIDVSAEVRRGSKLNVEFKYTAGQSALQIDGVELEADGKVVSRDEHEGWTGLEHRQNKYTLEIPYTARKATRFIFVARVRGASGTDSTGEILFLNE